MSCSSSANVRSRVVWVSLSVDAKVDPTDARSQAEIGAIFKLHQLALEDTVNTGQRPKVDFFDDHAFVVDQRRDQPDGVARGREGQERHRGRAR